MQQNGFLQLRDMADLLHRNSRLQDICMMIEKLHLSYLQTDESLYKIEQRNKLEGYIKEYLCLVPHDQKFSFRETAEVLHQSAALKEDFSGYRAASAWNAIGMYAANLLSQPWRKEYRELKLFCGFYKHEIEGNLVGADLMLQAMGYKPTRQSTMVLEGPIDPDRVSNVSRDSLMAFVECQLLKGIWEEVSCRFKCSWLEVLQFRENHVGTPETATKGLVYRFHQRQYQEQQLAALHHHHHHHHHPVDSFGTTSRIYGSQFPASHVNYYNYSPYAANPHSYTLPPAPRYPGIISPQQAIPPGMTYPAGFGMPHPMMKSQDMYPPNGHHSHFPLTAHLPLQNGYAVPSQLPMPMVSAPTVTHNYNHPVPTAQLIELDGALPQSSVDSEPPQTYSTADSSPPSVLIPRTVRQHSSTQHQQTLSKSQVTTNKAKDDGTGTFESWDYVFRNLESQGYSKDLGERPDVLSPPPPPDRATLPRNVIEENRIPRKEQQSGTKDLEETLMELRLEEYHKKIMPDNKPLKINEALQKIHSEPLKVEKTVEAIDATVSVYDNMSSPPKEILESERPVTIATGTSSKPNHSSRCKPVTRTLPRDVGRYSDEMEKPPSLSTHYSSTTLDPKHLRESTNSYVSSANEALPSKETISSPGPPSQMKNVDIPDEEKWECITCTFLNLPNRDVCEMCGKSKTRGPEVKPLASGGRECPQCTLVNEKGVGTCEACGASLKDSPTYI